ncbi:MAG: hypothetical protein R3279_05365 [Putridiphycobacter sp.]|nr:hypothetical protein [Putridiphycobacter sp.]
MKKSNNSLTPNSPIVISAGGSHVTPIVLGIIGIGAIGLGAKYLIDKAKDNKQSDNFGSDTTTDKTVVYNEQTGQLVTINQSWSASQIASEWDVAMGGDYDGTEVQQVINLADKSKAGRWPAISEAYRKQTGKNILPKLKSELNSLEYKAVISVLDNNKPYKFGGAELLHVKNHASGVTVWNKNLKKFETESFIWNGSLMGYVTERSTSLKGGKFYSFNKYPHLEFQEKDLYRDYDSWTQKIYLATGI